MATFTESILPATIEPPDLEDNESRNIGVRQNVPENLGVIAWFEESRGRKLRDAFEGSRWSLLKVVVCLMCTRNERSKCEEASKILGGFPPVICVFKISQYDFDDMLASLEAAEKWEEIRQQANMYLRHIPHTP